MAVTFAGLVLGEEYDRPSLARRWGYKDWHAIARGVVTPVGERTIIVFLTKEKQVDLTQYVDDFDGDELHWEGETNHRSDDRIANARTAGDEIHLFYRQRHHSPFTYVGEMWVKSVDKRSGEPSRFVCSSHRFEALATSSLATLDAASGIADEQFEPDVEGRKKLRQHIQYERSQKNRAQAIKIHGTVCAACKFDFDAFYGSEYARGYIEIHHVESVTHAVKKPDPSKDLIPLCANCHKMAHRRRGQIVSVGDIRALIDAARSHEQTRPTKRRV